MYRHSMLQNMYIKIEWMRGVSNLTSIKLERGFTSFTQKAGIFCFTEMVLII